LAIIAGHIIEELLEIVHANNAPGEPLPNLLKSGVEVLAVKLETSTFWTTWSTELSHFISMNIISLWMLSYLKALRDFCILDQLQ